MAKNLISVIIPVYMNEGSLHETYIRLLGVLKQIKDDFDYEMIFINDGSTDNSYDELISIGNIDEHVKIINFTRNFGQQSAIYAGFNEARGDCMVTLSADLQDPPELILDMVAKWIEGYKVAAGKRTGREDSFIAKISSKIFYKLINMSVPRMPQGGYDYFLLDKIVYKKVFDFNERNNFLQCDVLWLGYEPYFIDYKRMKRTIGKSQWSTSKKIKAFIDGIINTSYFPIRLMSLIGILTSVLGFLYSIAVFISWIFKDTPFSGYTPIMMALLILSGLIMTMLGVIGEYLWRTYDQIRGRPRYVIKKD
jgi:glycosyltransferase involved in cell wall biosynthesis